MLSAQPRELARAPPGDPQPYHPVILPVALAPEQSRLLGPVDELGCGVVTEHQRVGNLLDGGSRRIGTSPHGEEQLVLGGGETLRPGSFLAPPEEVPELRTELEQVAVVTVGEVSVCTHRINRNTI